MGRIDKDEYVVDSEGVLNLKRLDHIGYMFVHANKQAVLESYLAGETDLRTVIGALANN